MPEYPEPMARLIEELRRLPGIGHKSAQRIAFYLLKADAAEAEQLADSLRGLKQGIRLCEICHNFTDTSPCAYCSDTSRDSRLLCVIEEPGNIVPIERTGKYRGCYHVLHGVLSPLHGIGPEQLRIASLLDRVKGGGMVTVSMNGAKRLLSVKIDPEALQNKDVEMIEDLVLAAFNEAMRRVDDALAEKLGGLTGGLKIPGLF